MDDKNLWLKKAPATIIGVIAIGIICSALYDFFVKPGLNKFSEALFNLLTFGSQKVKDYSFSTAALDPTSIPALILLIVLFGVVINYFGVKIAKIYFSFLRKEEKDKQEPSERKRLIYKWLILPVLLTFAISYMYVPFNVFNQAILTWRVFHSNTQIISPYTTDREVKLLRSQFASMKKESDYDAIFKEMQSIAKNNNVELRSEKPW